MKKIYTELKEVISPEHTAIVVWDVQNLLVSRIFNKDEFIKNIQIFLEAARENNIPIIYSQITPLTREFESPSRIYGSMKRFGVTDPDKIPQFLLPGSIEAEIHNSVSPHEGDIILPKNTASIFIGTNFENLMRNRCIESIIFTGISTEFGISSSARDAANRGFFSIVASDCVSSGNEELHHAALKVLKRMCIVKSSEDLMEKWKSS